MIRATSLGRRSIVLAALCAAALGFTNSAKADLVLGFSPAGPVNVLPGGAPTIFTVDLIVNGPEATDQANIQLQLFNIGGANDAGVIFRGPPAGATQPATYTAASFGGAASWTNPAGAYGANGGVGGGPGRRFLLSGDFGAGNLVAAGPNQFIATINVVIPANSPIGTYAIRVTGADFTTQGGTNINSPIGQQFVFNVIPEPSSIVLSMVGVAGGLGVWLARRRNAKKVEEVTVAA